jgi:hypothetical protein
VLRRDSLANVPVLARKPSRLLLAPRRRLWVPGLRLIAFATPSPSESPSGAVDAVEQALAEALNRASKANRWDLVAQLARALEARRTAQGASNVVALEVAKRRR